MRHDRRTSRDSRPDAPRPVFREHSSHEPGPSGSFFIYGRRPVLEALKKGAVISVQIAKSAHGEIINEIVKSAEERQVPVRQVVDMPEPEDVVTQGVTASARPPEVRGDLRDFLECLPKDPLPLILMLDGITDPHNFGAILRTAEGAGVTAVIFRERRQAPVTDTVVKASAGAAYLLPLFHVANLAQTVRLLKDAGLWIVASVGEEGIPAWNYDWDRPATLIVGAEGAGVSDLLLRDADDAVKIPMYGHIESLNVSVATGVLLFEAARKRTQIT